MRYVNISVGEFDISDLEGVPPGIRGGAQVRRWTHKGCEIREYGCKPAVYCISYEPTGKEVYIEGTAAEANAVAAKIGLIA